MNEGLSYEYIRGLVDGEGCFTFCSAGPKGRKRLLPAFVLSMSKQDKDLLILVRDTLGLHNQVYEYPPRPKKDRYNRQPMAILIIRDIGQLKNIIAPLFHKKLAGNKSKQFDLWLERIKNDPLVPRAYKLIPKLCECGFYEKNSKFIN